MAVQDPWYGGAAMSAIQRRTAPGSTNAAHWRLSPWRRLIGAVPVLPRRSQHTAHDIVRIAAP